jgi:hypothetical protein
MARYESLEAWMHTQVFFCVKVLVFRTDDEVIYNIT